MNEIEMKRRWGCKKKNGGSERIYEDDGREVEEGIVC